MPQPPEKVLKELVAATEEAKTTIRQLHEARQAGLEALKTSKKVITDAIVSEVDAQVKLLWTEAREEMKEAVDKVITRIEVDWRTKLGLDV